MKSSSKILAAAAAGVVAGSLLSLLFAPGKGKDTRKKIAKQGNKLLKNIKGKAGKEEISRIKEKLENKLQKVNEKLEELSKEAIKNA